MALFSKVMGVIYLLIALYLINAYFGILGLGFLDGIKEEIMFLAGVIILIDAIIFFVRSPKRTPALA